MTHRGSYHPSVLYLPVPLGRDLSCPFSCPSQGSLLAFIPGGGWAWAKEEPGLGVNPRHAKLHIPPIECLCAPHPGGSLT